MTIDAGAHVYMAPALTARQEEILTMIRAYIEEEGFPPTRANICKAMGFKSPNAAEAHLRAIERKGAIQLVPGIARGIRVTRDVWT